MTTLREAAQQALEAMRRAVPTGKITLYEWDKALSDLADALARIEWVEPLAKQAEPVEPVALTHRHEWFRTGNMEPGQFRCIHCGVWAKETAHD